MRLPVPINTSISGQVPRKAREKEGKARERRQEQSGAHKVGKTERARGAVVNACRVVRWGAAAAATLRRRVCTLCTHGVAARVASLLIQQQQ